MAMKVKYRVIRTGEVREETIGMAESYGVAVSTVRGLAFNEGLGKVEILDVKRAEAKHD